MITTRLSAPSNSASPRPGLPASAAIAARRLFVLALAAAALLHASPAWARRAGARSFRNGSFASGGQTCLACHSNSTGFSSGSVTIVGAPDQYNLNRLYTIAVIVQDSVQAGGGFELSAESGTGAALGSLLLSDAVNTRYADNNPAFVTHTATGVSNGVSGWAGHGNSVTYTMQWRAPATDAGAVTFFTAGLAINNNNSSSLDRLYLAQRAATAAACVKGDANGDGVVDGQDISGFVAAQADPDGAGPALFCACDMDNDGTVTAADLSAFTNRLLGP